MDEGGVFHRIPRIDDSRLASKNECRRLLGFVPKDESREHGGLGYMIMCLYKDRNYHRHEKLLFDLKQLRNDAVHEESSFNRIKAQTLIEGVRELENISRAGALRGRSPKGHPGIRRTS